MKVTPAAYTDKLKPWTSKLSANGGSANHLWDLSATSGWYDFVVSIDGISGWQQRFAGRLDTSNPTTSDPASGGSARMAFDKLA
jgi:phospholipase C